jgi:hypothetical protein
MRLPRPMPSAAAVSLATAAATGVAVAQEQPRQDQRPTGQQLEKDQNHRGQTGAMERGQSGQAQATGEEGSRNERISQGKMGQEKMREQPDKPANDEGKAAERTQPSGEERANQAQTEKMSAEKRAGEQNKTNAQGAQNNQENGSAAKQGQASRAREPEKGKAEGTGQASGNENRTAEEKRKSAATTPANENRSGQAQTGGNEMQNNRRETGQNTQNGGQNGQSARRETHVNPQAVRAEGNANLTKDKAARVADTLMTTARPQNVNVDVHVGALLPGNVDLTPLPPTIVDLVPEYRGYDYVVVNDEIVIVQPSTRNVVEVINTGGGMAMNEGGAEAMAGTRRRRTAGGAGSSRRRHENRVLRSSLSAIGAAPATKATKPPTIRLPQVRAIPRCLVLNTTSRHRRPQARYCRVPRPQRRAPQRPCLALCL